MLNIQITYSNIIKSILVFACIIISISPLKLAAENSDKAVDVAEIVNKIDTLFRSSTSVAKIEMIITTPNWTRRLKMDMWTKGLEKTFIRILTPKKDAGIATLRVEKSMWNYFPKINKVIKVPPSMMMSSWMGSDFTNDDLVKESSLLNDYNAKFICCAEKMDNNYCIELTAKKNAPTVWGKIILMVRKKDIIPVSQTFFDEKGEAIRLMNFKDVKMFGNRKMPATMEMIPLKNRDKKTVMHFINAIYDQNIDKLIFTRRNLQKKR